MMKLARYNYENSLLPKLVIVPNEAPVQLENQIQEWGKTAGNYLQGQVLQNLATIAATGKPLSSWLMIGGNKALNNPQVANGIATFAATNFGRPIVNGVKHFTQSPTGQKFGNYLRNAVDWIF